MNRYYKFGVGACLLVGAIGYLMYAGLQQSSTYYFTIDEFLPRKSDFAGQGVRVAGDHLGYIVWLFVLDVPLVLAYCLWRRPGAIGYFRQRWRFGLIGGVLSGGAYGISIFAMSRGGLASVSSLRETSVIFAAVMSSLLLKERFRHRRYVSVLLVATGAVLLH